MVVCVLEGVGEESVGVGGEAKGRRTPPRGTLVVMARDWEEGMMVVVVWNRWDGIWTMWSVGFEAGVNGTSPVCIAAGDPGCWKLLGWLGGCIGG